MSQVTVHGPNTMYTTQSGGTPIASSPAGATATKSVTNGLVYNFAFPNPNGRPAADFDWTFTGPGSPAAQNDTYSGTVTYSGAGSGTVVCTVAAVTATVTNKALTNNVATLTMASAAAFAVGETVVVTGVDATFNGTYVITAKTGTTISYAKTAADVTSAAATGTITASSPASGAYTINVSPTAGAPRSLPPEGMAASTAVSTNGGAFDPGEHNVAEVVDYAQAHPDEAAALYDAEVAGKNRTTLLGQLEALMPYDPGRYTVADVVAYAQANPDQVPDIIAAEEAGKNRTTLLNQLHALA